MAQAPVFVMNKAYLTRHGRRESRARVVDHATILPPCLLICAQGVLCIRAAIRKDVRASKELIAVVASRGVLINLVGI